MKDIAKTSRVNTALQVIQHMNDGKTVVAACKEVGIPRSTFYDVVKKNPEAVTEFQEIVCQAPVFRAGWKWKIKC